jgi:hypothetical protein
MFENEKNYIIFFLYTFLCDYLDSNGRSEKRSEDRKKER